MTHYTIELDLHLVFAPPMDENGPGIVLTRRIDWDADRQVFLATTHNILSGFPFATIPNEIRSWIGHGWRLGSWIEHYRQEEEPEAEVAGQATFEQWLVLCHTMILG